MVATGELKQKKNYCPVLGSGNKVKKHWRKYPQFDVWGHSKWHDKGCSKIKEKVKQKRKVVGRDNLRN